MDDVKLAVPGEGRKAGAAGGAPRRPLVPSEKGNAAAAPGGGRRREAAASRFKPAAPAAAAAARRCTSPISARTASAVDSAASCNRARSAERARPATTSPAPSRQLKPSAAAATRSATPPRDPGAEPRGAPRATSAKQAPDGLSASSARSASPSPRSSESAPTPAKKIDRLVRGLPSEAAKVNKVQADAAPERKRSPVRRNGVGTQCENARPLEPAAKRIVEQHRWPAMMTSGRGSAGLASANISPSAGNASRAASSSSPSSAGHSPMRMMRPSESTGKHRSPSNEMAKRAAIRRSRKEDADSDASSQTSEGSKPACRASRAISVPILHRSSSLTPSKVVSAASCTSKACQSPSRIRPSAPCRSKCASSAAQPGAAQPAFNYIVDARKGKKQTANQIENIHQLRLLDNRHLQWRFVNAISEATLSFRRNSAESAIFSVAKSILTLQDALTTTRIDVRLLQQEMKLHDIVTKQITYLEQWLELEEENSRTLTEAIEALKASTLRLPVTSGAQAEAVAVKNAVSSAVDVMQALSSSICYLQSKVEDRTSLVSELSVMARQEKAALDECRQLLATTAKLQVQEYSLRTHLMQLREDSG